MRKRSLEDRIVELADENISLREKLDKCCQERMAVVVLLNQLREAEKC